MPFSSTTLPTHRRKTGAPKPGKWLRSFWPYLAIILAVAGYGVFWLAACAILRARLAHEADQLRRAGYSVELTGRRIGGFPYRLRLHYDRLSLVGPSGWGVVAPGLDAQALIYAPHHWVVAAPNGLEVERGGDGPLSIRSDVLRASIAGVNAAPWRIALEGEGLRFATPTNAHPFTFTRVDRFDALLRPAPDHSGGQFLMRLTGAYVAPKSALAPVAGAAPLTLDLAARLTKPEAFKGAGWARAVRAWSRAGGETQVVRLRVDAGRANLSVDRGALQVGEDGRVAGAAHLHVALPSSFAVLPIVIGGHANLPVRIVAAAAALVRTAGGALDAPLEFKRGRTVLDGVSIGPAFRVYDPTAKAKLRLRSGP